MYTVYIVDDSVLVRKELLLTTPWEVLDCNVIGHAGDGRKAMEDIVKTNPDIVITDIRMPKMDGLELIKELKVRSFNTEFVVISAFSEFEYALKAIKLGVHDYILKPINDDELMETISKVIDRIKEKENSNIIVKNLNNTLSSKDLKIDLLEDYAKRKISIHLRNAMEFIELYHMKDLTIRDVAKELKISDSYMTKLFKQEINTTFIEYLTNVRVAESIKLMKDDNLPIYIIAERVGYKDYRYFSMVFKKTVGISPKKYQSKII